jgi:hypothetical protein
MIALNLLDDMDCSGANENADRQIYSKSCRDFFSSNLAFLRIAVDLGVPA